MRTFNHFLSLFGFIIIIFFTSACNSNSKPSKEYNEVAIGETFEIRVKENKSTGYEMCWVNKKDARAISLVKKNYKREGASDCAGCGGTATFTFKGMSAGTDTIKLVNCPGLRENKSCDECSVGDAKVEKFIAVVK